MITDEELKEIEGRLKDYKMWGVSLSKDIPRLLEEIKRLKKENDAFSESIEALEEEIRETINAYHHLHQRIY